MQRDTMLLADTNVILLKGCINSVCVLKGRGEVSIFLLIDYLKKSDFD